MYALLNHFAIYLKQIQHYKSTTFQKIKNNKQNSVCLPLHPWLFTTNKFINSFQSIFSKENAYTRIFEYLCIHIHQNPYSLRIFGFIAFKKESLGGGDIKLSLLAGMILGGKLGIIYIIFACFLAFPYAIYLQPAQRRLLPHLQTM